MQSEKPAGIMYTVSRADDSGILSAISVRITGGGAAGRINADEYERITDKTMQNMVYLRRMTVEDTDKIVTWRNKDFVQANFIYQKPFTREGHLSWIRNQVEKGHVVQFIICLAEGREIGSVYFRDIDREAGTAEYGIFIGEEDTLGHGYGTAAARAALAYAFTRLHLQKVFLRFLADNTAARKSYEHVGFIMTDRKEAVMTKQGRREVCFMEINGERFTAAFEQNGMKVSVENVCRNEDLG